MAITKTARRKKETKKVAKATKDRLPANFGGILTTNRKAYKIFNLPASVRIVRIKGGRSGVLLSMLDYYLWAVRDWSKSGHEIVKASYSDSYFAVFRKGQRVHARHKRYGFHLFMRRWDARQCCGRGQVVYEVTIPKGAHRMDHVDCYWGASAWSKIYLAKNAVPVDHNGNNVHQ